MQFSPILLLCLLAAAPGSVAEPISDCEAKGNARPICSFTNPEDIVSLPGNRALLIGEYGASAEDHSGGLVIFELDSETRRTIYRGGEGKAVAEAGWGDPACTSPPSRRFNSHGIDLVRRDDGRLQLLVVQHGGREAIELFEVLGSGTDWRVEWRGCVPAPSNASLNDVAALSNGDFYTTQMTPLDPPVDLTQGLPTYITGHAYAWSQADLAFRKIPGSEGSMPNGIATSSDGRYIYMNATSENSMRKVEVATGRELGRVEVDTPDNLSWAPDGRLLVASLDADLTGADFAACVSITHGACRIPFKIVAIDPDAMTILRTVYESKGAPMGAGTVGLQVGRELFIGSFKGDRILRVALQENDETSR
ncbi:MAG: SMP-30/gluconolactonase/LRE family protein [Pseudomonadota bacterium]|nr:SMP-30/gluconolactonase/LRE family protein [Pseudomonadota bacterium]